MTHPIRPTGRRLPLPAFSALTEPRTFAFWKWKLPRFHYDPRTKEVRLPAGGELTRLLHESLRREELEELLDVATQALIAHYPLWCSVDGVKRSFAEHVSQQVRLVLAGGPREV